MASILLSLFLLFLPTQLGKHFWPSFSHIYALPIDYLSPTIYFTDILLFLYFLANLALIKKNFSKFFQTPIFYSLFFLFILNTAFSLVPQLSFLNWLRFFALYLLYQIISHSPQKKLNSLFYPLLLSSLIVSLLAVLQFLQKSSLDGLFYYLGERHFSLTTPNIAKFHFFNQTFLRPYSTFSHPNSLAAYLLTSLILLSHLFSSQKLTRLTRLLYRATILLSVLALVLSLSKSVFLALALVLFLHFFPKYKSVFYRYLIPSSVLLSFLYLFISYIAHPLLNQYQFIYQRLFLIRQSVLIFISHPLFGVGLNNFIPGLVKVNSQNLFLQPVHNSLFYLLSQLGLSIIPLLIIILKAIQKHLLSSKLSSLILVLLITSLLDHYWFTLPQNYYLLPFIFVFFFNN